MYFNILFLDSLKSESLLQNFIQSVFCNRYKILYCLKRYIKQLTYIHTYMCGKHLKAQLYEFKS